MFLGSMFFPLIAYKYFFSILIYPEITLFLFGLICLQLINRIFFVNIFYILILSCIVVPFLLGGILGLNDFYLKYKFPKDFLLWHYTALFILSICTFIIGWLYETSYFKTRFSLLINIGKLNENKARIIIDSPLWEGTGKKRKKQTKLDKRVYKFAGVFLPSNMLLLFIPIYLFTSQHYGLSRQDLKWYLGNIYSLFIPVLLFPFFGAVVKRIFYFIGWEIKNKRIMYTNWQDLIFRQNIINKNRIQNGMKPLLNIQSYYLPKSFYDNK